MYEAFIEWKRQKNLMTAAKFSGIVAILLTVSEFTDWITLRQTLGVALYLFILFWLLAAYRKFQHEDWVKRDIRTRRNADFGLAPWEFNHPKKLIELVKLTIHPHPYPIVAVFLVLFLLVPVRMALRAEIPESVNNLYNLVFVPGDPDIVYNSQGLDVQLGTIISPSSVFWLWDENSALREYPSVAVIAQENPNVQVYAIRSYGNDRTTFKDIELPENIILLDPQGFSLADKESIQEANAKFFVLDDELNLVVSASNVIQLDEIEQYLLTVTEPLE